MELIVVFNRVLSQRRTTDAHQFATRDGTQFVSTNSSDECGLLERQVHELIDKRDPPVNHCPERVYRFPLAKLGRLVDVLVSVCVDPLRSGNEGLHKVISAVVGVLVRLLERDAFYS